MSRLSDSLRTLADGAVAPPPPPDLWRRGMRRHRRRRAVGVAAAVLGLVALLTPVTVHVVDPQSARPADSGPAIPSKVQPPWPRQAQVTDLPVGPATLIVTGSGSLRSSDLVDGYEGRTMVVGRDGRYRLVDGSSEGEAGAEMFLSPDGRWLAVAGPVEGGDDHWFGQTSLIDLTSGKVTAVPGGSPIGWAPNSRHLLMYDAVRLLVTRHDAATGSSLELSRLAGRTLVPPYVTFTPDAFHFIVITGSGEVEYNETGEPRLAVGFHAADFRYRLAGPAAVNADGLLAYWHTTSGCNPSCAMPADPPGEFRLVFGNPGALPSFDVTDFDAVTGWMPRLLGWLPDGSAVVEVVEPTGRSYGPMARPRVIALKPGGGRTTLVTLPPDAHRVDLARDLVAEGRFGAAPPSVAARAADWARGLVPTLLVVAALIGLAVVGVRLRQRRESRGWNRRPG